MRIKNIIVIIVLCLSAVGLRAQSSDVAADTTLTLQEISVSAIKQSSNMRVQPIASTTIGGPMIERLNIDAMKNVSEMAPNFYMPDYGTRMTSSIYVRGLGARIDQPVVGLNVDYVPFMN